MSTCAVNVNAACGIMVYVCLPPSISRLVSEFTPHHVTGLHTHKPEFSRRWLVILAFGDEVATSLSRSWYTHKAPAKAVVGYLALAVPVAVQTCAAHTPPPRTAERTGVASRGEGTMTGTLKP